MTISECSNDFEQYRLKLGDNEFFNRLVKKQTRLTTPSIVCYCYTDKNEVGRTYIKSIEKIYISGNPSADIEEDKALFKEKDVDEILIMHNDNGFTNSPLLESEKKKFEDIIEEIKKFYFQQ
jgi:hypothetical protein